MTKLEVKNTISKYTDKIEIEFYLTFEDKECEELSSLNIVAWYDDAHIILETVISGTDSELKKYTDYIGLKKSYITKYNDWIAWFANNYKNVEIKANRIVCHV